jgi:glycosyltransferase involved in cell wall biosynthesis
LSSLSEGFGIVQLEAMAHGLPVIASDRTGDVMTDKVNVIRVPAGDIDALANNLCTLAEDANLLAHITSGARKRVGDFDFCHVAEQWHAVLSNATPRKTPRG